MKKGFTLIELLAVIMVLSFIVVIAIPTIGNIITNSEKESREKSIELYARAIKDAILTERINGNNVTHINQIDNFDEYYTGNVECEDVGISPEVDVYLAKCKVDGVLVKGYTYGEYISSYFGPTLGSLCEKVSDVETSIDEQILYEAGDKYLCNVDPEKPPFTFFILNTVANDATNVNLIMDRNISIDGLLFDRAIAQNGNNGYNVVAWYPSDNSYGPVTAMNFLSNATKNWINLENIKINYTDEGNRYGTIKTEGNITTITKKDKTTVTATYTDLKARLPYSSELTRVGCSSSNATCPTWIRDYLSNSTYSTNVIQNMHGFWTFSSNGSYGDAAQRINYNGALYYEPVRYNNTSGIRPVINLML